VSDAARPQRAGSEGRLARVRRFLLWLRHNNPIYVNRRGKRPVGRLSHPPTPAAVLDELARLDVSTWRYKWDDPDVRHLGPMAQDFAAAFGLGENERWIDTIDADGVNMVAIKELARRLRAVERRLQAIEALAAESPSQRSPASDGP